MSLAKEYDTLEDYYEDIEGKQVFKIHSYSNKLKLLYDKLQEEEEKRICRYETLALDFSLQDGEVVSLFSTTYEDGREYHYPSINEIDKYCVEYFLNRLNQTSNNSLKITYSQIVANTKFSHLSGKAINVLIDGWISEVNSKLLLIDEKNDVSYEVWHAIANVYPWVIKSKYRVADLRTLILNLIFNDKYSILFKTNLVKVLISNRKVFKPIPWDDIIQVCKNILNSDEGRDIRMVEYYTDLLIKISRMQGVDFKIWHKVLAEAYEREIDIESDHNSHWMIALDNCEKSIAHYHQANEKENVERMLIRYAELRKSIKLQSISVDFDGKEINLLMKHYDDYCLKFVKKHSAISILQFLSDNDRFFPDLAALRLSVKNRPKGFMDFALVRRYDHNKNASVKAESDEEKELDKLLSDYHFYIQMQTLQFLRFLFHHGRLYRKINYETVMFYLKNYTWLGQQLKFNESDGTTEIFNWVSLISPGLQYFFSCSEANHRATVKNSNLILAIDSLTLKFEGMLRDFCRILGIQTLSYSKSGIREMYIEDFLANKTLQDYFNENDRLFFRYVFVSKKGIDLRNNIAHSFYRYNDYSFDKAILIVLAILRLGKYHIDTSKVTM